MTWADFQQCDFSNLKKLGEIKFSGASIRQFLGRLPVIEEYGLATLSLVVDTVIPTPTYVSNLRRLEIYVNRGQAWNNLCLPHLIFLSMETGEDIDRAAIEEISSILLPSEAVLQEMELNVSCRRHDKVHRVSFPSDKGDGPRRI